MAIINTINTLQPRIIPRLTPLSPFEIYLQQVKGTFDAIRFGQQNVTYYPAQFGGLLGQLSVIDEVLVLELTDFRPQIT